MSYTYYIIKGIINGSYVYACPAERKDNSPKMCPLHQRKHKGLPVIIYPDKPSAEAALNNMRHKVARFCWVDTIDITHHAKTSNKRGTETSN